VLLVMTNNASFGDGPGSRQHLANSQLRAVEEGRSVVQAAVTGISALIGPDGRTSFQTGLYQQTTVRAAVAPSRGLTPYTRYGRGIEWGLVGLAVAGVLAAAVLWWVARRRGRRVAGVGDAAPLWFLGRRRQVNAPAAAAGAADPARAGVEGRDGR
jgi:apolipoprotein N-acyltransferase